MKNKIHLIVGFLILNITLLSLGNVVGNVVWIYWTEADDVVFYVNNVPQYEGDYHDEIDIIQIALNNSNIVFQTQTTPVNDADHIYYLDIYWTQTGGFNSTSGIVGMGNNQMATYLRNSIGQDVASLVVQDSITVENSSFIMPIPLFAQIPGTDDPYYIQVQAIAITGENEKFEDYSNGTTFSEPIVTETPGLANTYFSALIVACFILTIIKKKKK
ncbi:MAG: hypothetical protein JXA54_10315 [Candidatus Heimdallarchaeota archaeon]|nr:hypothetical protein [Candidatus Heimdallarchaeota archaeon]